MTDAETDKPEEPVIEPAASPEVEAEYVAPAQTPATIGNRILAVLIDGLVCMALSVVPVLGALAAIAYMLTRDALPFLDGQSIGKKAMKLRAVNAETNAPLTNDWGPSVIRNVVLYIPFFPLVELIVLSNNKDNQRLGDQWAKTKVVTVG